MNEDDKDAESAAFFCLHAKPAAHILVEWRAHRHSGTVNDAMTRDVPWRRHVRRDEGRETFPATTKEKTHTNKSRPSTFRLDISK